MSDFLDSKKTPTCPERNLNESVASDRQQFSVGLPVRCVAVRGARRCSRVPGSEEPADEWRHFYDPERAMMKMKDYWPMSVLLNC